MSLSQIPSSNIQDDPKVSLDTPFVENLRGPLSDGDLAFLQAWVDFAEDVKQPYSETTGPEPNEELEISHATLVFETRKFALTQRVLALRTDAQPVDPAYSKTFGNTIYSPRASAKALCCSGRQLCFNPIFGALFHGGAADSDDEDAVLLGPLRSEQLSYQYEAIMRADMRDLEAFGLIHWSPDELVDAELARRFDHSHPEAPPPTTPCGSSAGGGGRGGDEDTGGGGGKFSGRVDDGGGAGGGPSRTGFSCSTLSLDEDDVPLEGPPEAATDVCLSPGTPAAVRSMSRCFRRRPTVMPRDEAAYQQPDVTVAACATSASQGAASDDSDDDNAAWLRFLDGLGQLSYEYEALMRADMRDLEAFGLIHWSTDELVDAELARAAGRLVPAAAAADPWVTHGGSASPAQSQVPTAIPQDDGAPRRLDMQQPQVLCGPSDCGDGGGSAGGGVTSFSIGCGRGGCPSLALPAPCLSALTGSCASPSLPPTPAARCTKPPSFRASPATLPDMQQLPAASYAAAAAAAVGMAAIDTARGGDPNGNGGGGVGGDDDEDDVDNAAWRRFLDGLGQLPYEYEAIMRADMRDLEAFGFIHWSPDDLVDAELARAACRLVPPAAAAGGAPAESPPPAQGLVGDSSLGVKFTVGCCLWGWKPLPGSRR